MSDTRATAVAGTFYPADADELRAEVERFLASSPSSRSPSSPSPSPSPSPSTTPPPSSLSPSSPSPSSSPPSLPLPRLGVLAPHAGYIYSGGIAGRVYAATVVPERVVVLAPNHTGLGDRRAIWARGSLELPGGALPVDEELGARLLATGLVRPDHEAHRREHALEVQLPFLRARNAAVRVTPIVLGPLDADACCALGEALAAVAPVGTLVVASSDMSHYLDDASARRVDHRALAPLLALDARALHDRVEREDISMCGYVAATVMLAFCHARGAVAAELVGYATSGDAFGDRTRVVGYAGVVVS